MYLFLLIIGVVFVLILLLKIDNGLNTSYIFRSFLLFSFIIWYILPIFLSLIGNWDVIENIVNIPLDKYIILATFEVWFYAIILLLFNLSKKYHFKQSYIFVDNLSVNILFIPLMIVFTIGMLVYNIIYNFNYVEVNDIENAQGSFYFILNTLNLYILSFLWINVIVKSNKKYQVIFIIIIITNIIYYILSGSRIYLVAFIWLFYFINREKIKLNWLKYSIPALALVIGSLVLLPFLATMRVGDDSLEFDNDNNISELVLYQLNTKTNSIGYSSVLLEDDGIGFAGINPYLGSLMKFFPRAFWKDKPTPTSYNGDVSGTPSRRIPFLLTGTNGSYNVGVSAGIVSLWQGYFFVVLAILLNVIFLRIIASTLSHDSLLIKAIGLMLFYFPQLIMTPSYGDNIIQKLFDVGFILFILLFSGALKIQRL